MNQDSAKDPKGILPHRAFSAAISEARFESFRKDPRVRVRSEAEFEAMKAHLRSAHEGVEVVASFVDSAGQIFDCIPIEQQLSLKASGEPVATPPSLAAAIGGSDEENTEPAAQPAEVLDRHGNLARCPAGCIPVRRITIDELARFRSLDEYFSKGFPLSPPSAPSTDVSQNHRYAYAHQTIDNLGGHSFINLRAPSVTGDQIFSLSQHWYSAGSGAGHQTVEVGWQVFPNKYGHSQPVFFIYWTSDNYGPSGAYNLDKTGFVQTNSSLNIGGALSPVGDPGGQQYELEVSFYLNGGNWWLYVGGLRSQDAVGYYPGTLFNGGAMATNATSALYGGETVCGAAGPWPEMGSGAFAGANWPHAAWHRSIFVLPTGGGAQWASLTGESPSPACYDQFVGNYAAPWNVTLFYGGVGGSNC